MEFKIVSTSKGYEIWFFNEFDNRGIRWDKVIWDEENYCSFQDYNFTETIEEAEQKAAEFKDKFEKEHGILIKKFSL